MEEMVGEERGDGGMMTAWGIVIPTKGRCSGAFLLRLLCEPDLQCRYVCRSLTAAGSAKDDRSQ